MQDNEFKASFGDGMMKEHLILTRAVGIQHLVVVANKMDLIDWAEKKCKEKIKKVTVYLVKSLQWPRENLHVVPISAFDGTGLTNTEGLPSWYKGKSFIETLDDIPENPREGEDLAKDTVDNLIESDRFVCEITILNTDNKIVSAGYHAIIHFNGEESEVNIEKIKGKAFMRAGDKANCLVSMKIKKELSVGMKIILRKDDYTVGFGKILKIN